MQRTRSLLRPPRLRRMPSLAMQHFSDWEYRAASVYFARELRWPYRLLSRFAAKRYTGIYEGGAYVR